MPRLHAEIVDAACIREAAGIWWLFHLSRRGRLARQTACHRRQSQVGHDPDSPAGWSEATTDLRFHSGEADLRAEPRASGAKVKLATIQILQRVGAKRQKN
jgi:hypothetical protein